MRPRLVSDPLGETWKSPRIILPEAPVEAPPAAPRWDSATVLALVACVVAGASFALSLFAVWRCR